jgi:hypothetical protein
MSTKDPSEAPKDGRLEALPLPTRVLIFLVGRGKGQGILPALYPYRRDACSTRVYLHNWDAPCGNGCDRWPDNIFKGTCSTTCLWNFIEEYLNIIFRINF